MKKSIYIAMLLASVFLFFMGCKKTTVSEKKMPKIGREEKMASPEEKTKEKGGITITWLGHAAFLIEQDGGIKIVTDPYDSSVGYPTSSVNASVVTISHDHYDHNNIGMVKGNPEIIRGEGQKSAKGVTFEGILSYHDEAQGRKRGNNIIFIWELGGVRFAHMGDFGQLDITSGQLEKLKNVDVLLIPVGGTYTIDGAKARDITNAIKPKIAIPMHYKTDVSKIDIAPVSNFLQGISRVQNFAAQKTSKVTLQKDNLPKETEIWVLDYQHSTN